jgi:hypothetical protein
MTYNAMTHVWNMYVNGSMVGTYVADISSTVFNRDTIADDGNGYQPGTSIKYFREWQGVALTVAQVIAEANSTIPVVTSGLFTNTPLTGPSDLTDTTGGGHGWSSVGSPGSSASSPVLGTVGHGWVNLGQPPSNPTSPAGGVGGGDDGGIRTATTSGNVVVQSANEWGTYPGGVTTRTYYPDFTVSADLIDTANGDNGTAYPSSGMAVDAAGNFYYFRNHVVSGTDHQWLMMGNGASTTVLWDYLSSAFNPSSGPNYLAVDQAGTVLYVMGDGPITIGSTVTVWKIILATGVLSVFKTTTMTATGNMGSPMLVMPDGSVIIPWGMRTAAQYPKRYNSSGTLLQTYTSLINWTGTSACTGIAHAYTGTIGPAAIDTSSFFIGYYAYNSGGSSIAGYGVIVCRVDLASGIPLSIWNTPSTGFEYDGEFTALNTPIGSTHPVNTLAMSGWGDSGYYEFWADQRAPLSPTNECVPQGAITYSRGTIVQLNSAPGVPANAAYFFDKATGAQLGTQNLPGAPGFGGSGGTAGYGEVARLHTGQWLTSCSYSGGGFPNNIMIFDPGLASIISTQTIDNGLGGAGGGTTGGEEPGAQATSSLFYVAGNTAVKTLDATGTQSSPFSFPSGSAHDRFAVSPDGLTVYHGQTSEDKIYKTTAAGSSTFVDTAGILGVEGGAHRGMICLPNGWLVVAWRADNGPMLICYDTTGVPLWSATLPINTIGGSFSWTKDLFLNEDDTKVWAPVKDSTITPNIVRWYQVDAGTGAVTLVFTSAYNNVYYNGPAWVLRLCPPSTGGGGGGWTGSDDGGPGPRLPVLSELNIGLSVSGPKETYNYAVHPLRDPATYYGGPKPARVLNMGDIPRIASDYFTGAWQGQDATCTLIDTDHYLRNRVSLSGNPGFTNGEYWAYVIDNADRLARLAPRLLYYGSIRESPIDVDLTYSISASDILSAFWPMYSSEEPIPRIRIFSTAFPNLPASLLDPHTGVPFIGGEVSDEYESPPKGKIPLINVGAMVLNGTSYPAVGLLCIGAIDQVINAYKKDGTKITTWGSEIWAPGQSGWTTIIPSNAKYVVCNDGRWYTLLPMAGTLGTNVASGSETVSVNVRGMCYNSDGTGGMISKLFDLYKKLWTQFILQGWQSGPWLSTPLFEFWPGGASVPFFNETSFDVAQTVSQSYLGGGFQGAFMIGVKGQRTTVRQMIQDMNLCGGNLMLTRNYKMQLSYRMLDRSRTNFLQRGYKVNWKRDELRSVKRPTQTKRDWLFNIILGTYNKNYNTGTQDTTIVTNLTSDSRYGDLGLNRDYPLLGHNLPTVQAVAAEQLRFMGDPPKLYTWAETLNSFRYDVLDGVAVTDYNGVGPTGYVDRAMWVYSQSVNCKNSIVTMQAYDVDPLLS